MMEVPITQSGSSAPNANKSWHCCAVIVGLTVLTNCQSDPRVVQDGELKPPPRELERVADLGVGHERNASHGLRQDNYDYLDRPRKIAGRWNCISRGAGR